MKVQDILTKKGAQVITTQPDASLQDLCELLTKHNVGALVVLDSDHAPVGIISERDVIRAIAASGMDCLTQRVEKFMTTDIITALLDDELEHLSNIMTQKRIRHLPVMKGDELIGIVSIGDIVKAQLQHYEGEALTLRHYITGSLG